MSKLKLHISGSKSISNRFLIMEALSGSKVSIKNLSNSDDALVMHKILSNQDQAVWDVGHAGTAMRFLTAFAAIQNRDIVLRGSARMHQRPIGPLVEALRSLGAKITYLENDGFPPILVNGSSMVGGDLIIDGQMSSQFISALAMIAPSIPNGLNIQIQNTLVSRPYLAMTLKMMGEFGIKSTWEGNSIHIIEQNYQVENYEVESDWSSASYWFSFVALGILKEVTLSSYFENSTQGDAALVDIYSQLGVDSKREGNQLTISNTGILKEKFSYDFHEQPDIAQTVIVTCFGLGMEAELTGLETLPIKETDRLLAMQVELGKLGAQVQIMGQNSLYLEKRTFRIANDPIQIETYKDHRMAMSFAPLAHRYPNIEILEPSVVSKSYPDFWTDVDKI